LPLPPSVAREELHLRRIEVRGYRRQDGLYDIEARVTDTKSEPMRLKSSTQTLPAGEPLHDMWVRVVVDEDLTVHDIVASTDAAPYPMCPEATTAMLQLKGLRIGSGFSRVVRERLSGRQGCTHLTELLVPLATTAFQTLSPIRNDRPERLDRSGRPAKIDSCYAYASTRDLVRVHWPEFHESPPE
jgi:hypothetical protein